MTDKWFRPKRFGYGATPVTWEGWALVVSHLGVVFAIVALLVAEAMPTWLGVVVISALTVLLVALARVKTDGKWHWNWG